MAEQEHSGTIFRTPTILTNHRERDISAVFDMNFFLGPGFSPTKGWPGFPQVKNSQGSRYEKMSREPD